MLETKVDSSGCARKSRSAMSVIDRKRLSSDASA